MHNEYFKVVTCPKGSSRTEERAKDSIGGFAWDARALQLE